MVAVLYILSRILESLHSRYYVLFFFYKGRVASKRKLFLGRNFVRILMTDLTAGIVQSLARDHT